MPNPQLTGAGLVGLGFLRDTSLHGISSTDLGKGRRGVSLYNNIKARKKKGNKSWKIHERSEIHRNPSDDIRDPQWKSTVITWFRLIFILILFALQSSSTDLCRLLVSTTSNEIHDWRKVPKPSSHRDTERFKILSFKKMMTNEQTILNFQNICNKKSQNRQHLGILLDWNSKRAKESLQIWQGSYLHLYLYLRAALALVILDWANRLAKSSKWRPGFNYLHRASYIHGSHVTHWSIAGAVRPCKTDNVRQFHSKMIQQLFFFLAVLPLGRKREIFLYRSKCETRLPGSIQVMNSEPWRKACSLWKCWPFKTHF